MRRSVRTAVLLWLICGTAGTAVGIAWAQPQSGIVRPTAEPAQPNLELGAELFAGNCASCHGINGSGIQTPRPGAGDIPGAAPTLHDVGALAADFYLSTGQMPLSSIHDEPANSPVLFSRKEVQSLVQYVASLGHGPAIPHPAPRAGDIATGLNLFTDHCAGCHQIDAEGGYVSGARVPPLQDLTPTQIAEAVRIGPYVMPTFSPRQISDAQLNSIIAYVLHTSHDTDRGGWGIGHIGPIPEGLVAWWIGLPLIVLACRVISRRRKRT
jgi:ubiquinol-cytochrome c reductase cytochrome c subunit